MREDRAVEGALPAKHHDVGYNKKKFFKNQPTSSKNTTNNQNKGKGKKKSYPPCQYCGKMGHPPFRCWRRPDAKCSSSSSESWLIDSCYTNHMTYDRELFKCLNNTEVKWVRIGNGEQIPCLVQGLPCLESKIPDCRACQQGKQSRLPLKQSTWRATEKLQLIHVARPHNNPSLNGSSYDDSLTPLATAIATSSVKLAKTHSVTRLPPFASVVKDVDRKVIRRSGTHKEDTQRQGLKWPRANITTEEVKFKIQKPCKYFNSSRGCRNGSNCHYQHDVSGMSRIAKRLKFITCKGVIQNSLELEELVIFKPTRNIFKPELLRVGMGSKGVYQSPSWL
ncbi:hypothetical protein CR513_54210, partial [Mucuna pruriens]